MTYEGLAKIPMEVIKSKHLSKYLENHKIVRIQYLPAEESAQLDVVVVAVAPLPENLKLRERQIPVTKAKDMNEDQRQIPIFKNISE